MEQIKAEKRIPDLGMIVEQTRSNRPLVHCITNYVTANDCANILLACGGSAIMADDPDETAEITSACDGLVLNVGTPNPRKLEGIEAAGIAANKLGHPIVLDPVGVGGSTMRREAVLKMLQKIHFAAIRGNTSEIAALNEGMAVGRGVDAEFMDGNLQEAAVINACQLAEKTGAVIIVTGDTDIVTDGKVVYRVTNGHPMMRTITGAGCQLSALMGAYITANPEHITEAALASVCAMGYCGEVAHERLSAIDGNATYRNYIIDAVFRLTPDALERGAKYEIR